MRSSLKSDALSVHEGQPSEKAFLAPNYTQVPNDLMDHWLPELNGAELKVLLYLVRRNFSVPSEQHGNWPPSNLSRAARLGPRNWLTFRDCKRRGEDSASQRPPYCHSQSGPPHHLHVGGMGHGVREIRTAVFGKPERTSVRKIRTRRKKVIIRKKSLKKR